MLFTVQYQTCTRKTAVVKRETCPSDINIIFKCIFPQFKLSLKSITLSLSKARASVKLAKCKHIVMSSKAGLHKATEQRHAEHHMWIKFSRNYSSFRLTELFPFIYYLSQIYGRIAFCQRAIIAHKAVWLKTW